MTRLTGRPGATKGRTFPAELLTPEDVGQLMRAMTGGATGARNRAAIALMYYAGLRVGEALALKPADVDLKEGSVRVLHGKGDRPRTVGLNLQATALVERWTEERKKLGLRNGRLLCQLDGSPWSSQAVREMLQRAARKAGVEKRVHPHAFRHAHAAALVRHGKPIHVVRDRLGHADLNVTDRYLRQVAPDEVVRAVRDIPWEPLD